MQKQKEKANKRAPLGRTRNETIGERTLLRYKKKSREKVSLMKQ